MSSKNTSAEKKKRLIFWSLLFFYVSAIFYFNLYAYTVLLFFLDNTKLNLNLGIYLVGSFMAACCYLVLIKTKNLRTVKAVLKLSFMVIGYLILFVMFTKTPPERFHIFEYGVLSYFVYRALAVDLSEENLLGWGMIIVIFVGSLDESFQVVLPNRFGDVKDIFINCLSGLLGFGVLKTIQTPSVSENNKK